MILSSRRITGRRSAFTTFVPQQQQGARQVQRYLQIRASNSDSVPPPPPPPKRPQLRQIAPRVVRDSSRSRNNGSERDARPSTSLREPPLGGGSLEGDNGASSSGSSPTHFDRFAEGLANLVPGFRAINPREEAKFLSSLEKQRERRALGYGEWGADAELGDDWAYRPGAQASQKQKKQPVDRRTRYAGTDTPRDSWLRPIVDPQGVYDRLSFNVREAEKRINEESTLNSAESRGALMFAGVWLFLVPFGLGFFISRGFADPVLVYLHDTRPESFELSHRMKRAGAKHIRNEDARIRLEASIGKAPPLTPEEHFHHLQEAAHEYEHEKKEEIRQGLVNSISDSITLVAFFAILIKRAEGRRLLVSAIGRVTQGMSQTGKAFIIILVADILMGYHSEEGWTAAIELLSEHYNAEIEFPAIAIFVSTVPVLLDSLFKFWLFKNLNRTDPSASVTLKEMDRH